MHATAQAVTRERPGPATAGPLLVVNNIEVVYAHVILVLKGVSLAVPEGGIVALLGANGAGKTTTLKAISNLLRAERGEVTKGTIELAGHNVAALSPHELEVQFLSTDPTDLGRRRLDAFRARNAPEWGESPDEGAGEPFPGPRPPS